MSVIKPAQGLAGAATVAIGLAAGVHVVSAVLLLMSADEATSLTLDVLMLLMQVVAGVLFIAWMGRMRANSDVITSKHQHRYTTMWVYLGWFIPFGNLFIPFAVMQDIWRGSDRSQPMVGLQQRPKSGLVTAWWICYIASNGLALVAVRSAEGDYAALSAVAAAGTVAAAVLAARMIKQVTLMQLIEPFSGPVPAPAPGA